MAEFQVGEFTFSSKVEVKRLLGSYLRSAPEGAPVTDPTISDVLTALAREHPEAARKVGPGIERWFVVSNNDIGYNTRGFRAKHFSSEELVRFSYTDVIDPPTRVALVGEALTHEAIEITRRVRQDAFQGGTATCQLTGDPIPDITMADVIHYEPPRRELHERFLRAEGLTYSSVELLKDPEDSGYRLVDRQLAERWLAFQESHLGGLRVVRRRQI